MATWRDVPTEEITTVRSMAPLGLLSLIFVYRSFAIAAAMFMNSNSLPIALMQSLVVTVSGLKWGDDDNKDAMVGRALTYLVLYSTLGMVVSSISIQSGISSAGTPLPSGSMELRGPPPIPGRPRVCSRTRSGPGWTPPRPRGGCFPIALRRIQYAPTRQLGRFDEPPLRRSSHDPRRRCGPGRTEPKVLLLIPQLSRQHFDISCLAGRRGRRQR